MKPLICVMLATVLLGGATVGAGVAEAHGRKHWKHRHHEDRGRYVSEREVYLVREYYRPHSRWDRRPRHSYYRSGYLPRGWHRRMRAYPVYLERDLIVLPRGYRRGIIDGHAVVYSGSGLIIDVAVLF